MDQIIGLFQNPENIILILMNFSLAIYGLWCTIRIRKWRLAVDFVGEQLVEQEKMRIPAPKTKEKLIYAAPGFLKPYLRQIKI